MNTRPFTAVHTVYGQVAREKSDVTRYPESCGAKFHNVQKDHRKTKLKDIFKICFVNAIKNASQSEIRNCETQVVHFAVI